MPALRIVFLGSDPIALPLLDFLAGSDPALVELAGVFTQPDRPVGRGQKIAANAIKTWALAHGLPVFQPEKLTSEAQAQLAELRADLGLVMAYGHILKDDVIATPRLGTVNLHASLLPAYRGASPIQTAIACGERETGVTLMRIVRRLDAGPVADAERVPIGAADTALEVEEKLARACVPLLARTLGRIANETLAFAPQDDARATYCRKLEKTDGALDFSALATVLAARINGLHPWPGCSVEWQAQPLRFGLAAAEGGEPAAGGEPPAPGTVLPADGDALRVATGNGVLRVLRLQRPGGRMLSAAEFLRGAHISPGTVFPSRPMPPLVADQPLRK